ncbi:MAG: hypothetical protein RIR62_953 [Pseudomonadota bacterium]|jgi:hypothetical protein
MRRLMILAPLAVLTACGTPQEQCINRATRDIRVLDRLIAETRLNVGRGYAMEEYTVTLPQWERCPQAFDAEGQPLPPQMCLEDRVETRTRPVAIDIAAEGAKLDGMLAKRDQLARASEGAIAQCRAQHPE